jgi:hypothetical protein
VAVSARIASPRRCCAFISFYYASSHFQTPAKAVGQPTRRAVPRPDRNHARSAARRCNSAARGHINLHKRIQNQMRPSKTHLRAPGGRTACPSDVFGWIPRPKPVSIGTAPWDSPVGEPPNLSQPLFHPTPMPHQLCCSLLSPPHEIWGAGQVWAGLGRPG